jgi:large subunit ribosomal protein L31
MKSDIHPTVGMVQVRCASCTTKWLSTSTKLDGKLEQVDGKEYPTIVLETCNNCHPFYTDRQTFIDTAGRVEKFQKRFGKFAKKSEEKA